MMCEIGRDLTAGQAHGNPMAEPMPQDKREGAILLADKAALSLMSALAHSPKPMVLTVGNRPDRQGTSRRCSAISTTGAQPNYLLELGYARWTSPCLGRVRMALSPARSSSAQNGSATCNNSMRLIARSAQLPLSRNGARSRDIQYFCSIRLPILSPLKQVRQPPFNTFPPASAYDSIHQCRIEINGAFFATIKAH
jgi:hypothetical protein